MNPETRNRLITFGVLFFAGLILSISFLGPGTGPGESAESTDKTATSEAPRETPAGETTPSEAASESPAPTETAEPASADEQEPTETPAEAEAGAAADDSEDDPVSSTLVARRPVGENPTEPMYLGSLDPRKDRARIQLTNSGAGITSIVFSDFWTEARYKRQAASHLADPETTPAPPEDERYRLNEQPFGEFVIPLLASRFLEVDGTLVSLFGDVWLQTEPGHFTTEIVDSSTGKPVFEIKRLYMLEPGGYELTLEQTVRNIGETTSKVRWIQYGPGDMDRDSGSFIEVRRFHFGYLMNEERDRLRDNVLANGQMFERNVAIDQVMAVQELLQVGQQPTAADLDLWPNRDSLEQGLTLSWFGATNRYFSLVVHAPYDPAASPTKSLAGAVESVRPIADMSLGAQNATIFNELHGPIKTIAPGQTKDWNMGVYAGPLDRTILDVEEPYVGLNMQAIIVYLMSGCCTFCTFSWLANFLVVFLAMLHDYAVFDWALAIVVLVVIVRTLLHPLLRRGQIQMQRMGRLMSDLKPELDALKNKYANDPARMQQEQRRLFMERGVNPLGCAGGLLPTILQMPIWIALYAVLYFAFELRQQGAFFGVFQLFNDWSFLGDLSRPDHFIEFSEPVNIYITNLTGINLLPLMMGLVFFLQQKYMSPPPSPNMTPEQLQQQKIMKVMMVVLFPVMLYQAPSGLTLYILTSSAIGIMEGRQIRKHIDQMDLSAPPEKSGRKKVANTGKTGKKTKDKLGRMYAEKLEEARQKQLQKQRGPAKNFKKRDK